ncbi:hypothetical protein Dda_5294 [Drechslerella dactyloides]|uniref:DUF6594 domain-containing protein n=1 Tax=Drechslerella dactyloides TaxID=74499 RepID=A0AAD6IWB2_DREDA|nr:hypothetical protein Dda_5294 [Drechslerella dactyloides]
MSDPEAAEATSAAEASQPQAGRNSASYSGPKIEIKDEKSKAVREIGLLSTKADGTVTNTRVIELSPPGPLSNTSLVAVIKQGQAPYLAQLDLKSSNLRDQVDANDSFTGMAAEEPEPDMISIGKIPTTSSRQVSIHDEPYTTDDFPLSVPTNRMIRIPLAQPYNVTIDRDPSAVRDPDDKFSHSRDPEKDAPVKNITFAPGYPSTAAIMSTDAELSVYRRFDRLNARNLLYYQAELMYLESKLDKLDEEDRLLENPEHKYHLRHYRELWDAQDERTEKRRDVVTEIRYFLKEYNECLFYYKQLMDCPEPSDRVLTSIRNWRANQGDPPIIDISESAYEKQFESDLIALKPPKCDDPLSIFVQDNLGKFFKKPQPAEIPNSGNVLYYSETAIDLFVTVICTLLAIVVLVGSMTTLFFVESKGLRLGLVWVFTFLFAISIFLMAKLSKGEIFLATAA